MDESLGTVGGLKGSGTSAHDGLAAALQRMAPPTAVDRYRILRELGRGSLGVVYLAYDPQLDRQVALKLLLGVTDDPEVARASMLREARAVARVSHPNVIAVYDAAETDGVVYVSMEYVPGRTLRDWLDEHRDDEWRTILARFVQAGRGLAAAHAAGIVHRDFKPANAFVGDDDRVRVLDFGLARLQQDVRPNADLRVSGEEDATVFGSRAGTPAYMAPEQSEAGDIGPAADQFAFCVALWEALFGVRPLPTEREERLAAIEARNVADGSTPSRIPRRVRHALLRGLVYAPTERHPSMDELLRALGQGRGKRAAFLVVTGAWLLGGLAIAAARTPSEQCTAAQQLESSWGAERPQVHHALSEASPAFGPDVATRVGARLDRWVRAWADTYESSCTATKRREDMSPERYALVYACLEDARQQLRTRLDLLRAADETTTRNANSILDQIVEPTTCTRADVLASRHASADPDGTVETLWARIDNEAALLAAGKVDGRVDALLPLVDAARGTGREDLAASALATLGSARRWGGQHDPSQDDYEAAVNAAIAADAFGTAADAARAFAYGEQHEGDIEGALHWLTLARSFADRAPADAARGRGLDVAEAEFLLSAGRGDDALVAAQRGAALDGPVSPGAEEVTLILAAQVVGRVLHKLTRIDEAVERGQWAVSRSAELLGEGHPAHARALRMTAVFLLDAGRYADALAYMDRADVINADAGVGTPPQIQLVHLAHRASCHLRLGDYTAAAEVMQRGAATLDTDEGATGPGVAYALGVRGQIRQGLNDLAGAEQDLRRALELVRSAGSASASEQRSHGLLLALVLVERGHMGSAQDLLAELPVAAEDQAPLLWPVLQAMLRATQDPSAVAALDAAWPTLVAAPSEMHARRRVAKWAREQLQHDLAL